MARRSSNIVEDIAEITSRFPWWAGVFFAGASFLFLHRYAGREIPVAMGMNGLRTDVFLGMLRLLAFFGQLVIPAAFLLGSLASLILNFKRARLYDKASHSPSWSVLDDMSRRDFEFLVGEYFRRRKFSVETAKNGADGGVDLIAKKDRETYFIRCRQWKTEKAGGKVVRELLEGMVGAEATGGIVVTSGEFTKEAGEFAKTKNLLLLDGKELLKNMRAHIEFEFQPERKTGGKLKKTAWCFLVILVVAVCLSLLDFGKKDVSFFSTLSSRIKGVLPNGKGARDGKNNQLRKPVEQTERSDMSFSDGRVKGAMEKVLSEKMEEQRKKREDGREEEEKKYFYEIELSSGARVFSGNATITAKEVTYRDDKGLVVSLKRDTVKTVKKIQVDK